MADYFWACRRCFEKGNIESRINGADHTIVGRGHVCGSTSTLHTWNDSSDDPSDYSVDGWDVPEWDDDEPEEADYDCNVCGATDYSNAANMVVRVVRTDDGVVLASEYEYEDEDEDEDEATIRLSQSPDTTLDEVVDVEIVTAAAAAPQPDDAPEIEITYAQ